MKMKYFGLSETKLFHFHRKFKNGGGGGGGRGEGIQTNPLNSLWIRHRGITLNKSKGLCWNRYSENGQETKYKKEYVCSKYTPNTQCRLAKAPAIKKWSLVVREYQKIPIVAN